MDAAGFIVEYARESKNSPVKPPRVERTVAKVGMVVAAAFLESSRLRERSILLTANAKFHSGNELLSTTRLYPLSLLP